ncbi:serine protease [Nocardiopsis kunsanensis]|uniref:Serine protease n=1 Tax=Nocardiopsis kunsanensis TaxID=141693 RepID=A0A918X632_9ACTN|nr:CAP domain-containing protein [Nocardiopsis kunsanensis]GHD14713.1 serine protease [Nocardiopsis kunsanensis]
MEKHDPSGGSENGRRPRRRLLLVVGLAAVPVGLVLAASLVAVSGGGHETAAGEIGEGMSNEMSVPDASSDEDFFDDPTGAPEDSSPTSGTRPQDAQVTASSSPEDEETGSEDGGGSDDGDGSGGDSSGSGGGSGGGEAGTSSSPMAEEVVTIVNSERSQHGCDPVSSNPRLTAAAQEHSEDMNSRDYMDHFNPDGEGPGERAERHGYTAWGAENVAKGQQTAEQVMDAWMNSDGHRANILNCDLSTIGVGESGRAWTQKFGYE